MRAVVHADACDSVHARIGSRRDRGVPNGSVRREKVNLCMSEPRAVLAQGSERWHGRSVAIEVIPAHAIQDDQHDVMLVVLDGMRRDYFDRYAASMPTLTALRQHSAWFTHAEVNFLPTNTPVGHSTISTGTDPGVHGITGVS